MNVAIERASAEDANELMEIYSAAFRPDFEAYGECTPSYMKEREEFVRKIETSIFYKITLNEEMIVGGFEIHRRNDFHYHLYSISVHPNYQNKGIGMRALELMLAKHPEPVIWSLATPRQNPRTRHIYEKMGFVVSGETKSSGGVELVIYELLCGR